jgi:hypothetical protein
VIKPENSCHIKLANPWIVLNSGGGPTPNKPEVLLENPFGSQQNEQFPQPARRT